MTDLTSTLPPERLALIAEIRSACGVAPDEGPTDLDIAMALDGFAGQFDYWFDRVIAGAVKKYRRLIIARINPFVRGIEYQGFSAAQTARELVRDYTNRNFVTAGGWAIEKMAIALGAKNSKAAAQGIDLHIVDASGNQHLYVIKSGTVTRNSDILNALKRHARSAEKLLKQGGAKVSVFANYAVAAGATSSTFNDGIYRPSSAAFWAQVTGLNEDKAMRLAYEISRKAADMIRREAQPHIHAMEGLVRDYIGIPSQADKVDWEFLFERTMKEKSIWTESDTTRHEKAWSSLLATGYEPISAKLDASEVDL